MADEAPDAKISGMSELAECLSQYEKYVVSNVEDADRKREQFRLHLQTLMEGLTDLRVAIKYCLFDIESLRRENAALRKRLEGTGNEPAK